AVRLNPGRHTTGLSALARDPNSSACSNRPSCAVTNVLFGCGGVDMTDLMLAFAHQIAGLVKPDRVSSPSCGGRLNHQSPARGAFGRHRKADPRVPGPIAVQDLVGGDLRHTPSCCLRCRPAGYRLRW